MVSATAKGARAVLADYLSIFLSQEPISMNNFKNIVKSLWKSEEGLTTVEYAIAGALVGLAVVLAFTNLGVAVNGVITRLVTAVNS
jgi:pilus assembly protein Flp/PilA